MMFRSLVAAAVSICALAFMIEGSVVGGKEKDKEKPKYTIKEVMAKAHKSGLWKKVAEGKAEKEDREKLAELYKALMESTPPKGDAEAWKKTTTEMHKIAVDAIADPDAGKKLKVNCAACHGKFKEKK